MEDKISSQYEDIFESARDLGLLILEEPSVQRFREIADLLNEDERSVDLLNRLISIGKELREHPEATGEALSDMVEEFEWVKAELENNELVKNYITLQKEYVELLTAVLEKVKTPDKA
jgi:cell fate (sporulation/competence/biofilm development) regulator YlbF (YheA/YmcA/DUF963 family)